jgi:hypothetical protein
MSPIKDRVICNKIVLKAEDNGERRGNTEYRTEHTSQ